MIKARALARLGGLAVLAVAALPCAAAGEAALSLAVPADARATSASSAGPAASAPPGALMSASTQLPAQASRTRLLAMTDEPQSLGSTGVYQRPRFALGFRSNTMKSWLNHAGLDAHTCLAPVIRANTRIRSDGVSGTVWVYARCTFE